jgi:hypothetical protein
MYDMAVSMLFLHKDFGTDRYHGKVLVQSAHGSVQIAHGSVQIAHGSVLIAYGSIQIANGSVRIAHGWGQIGNGLVQIANGSVQIANGSVQNANGSVQIVNGLVQIAHGSVQIVQGSVTYVLMKPFRGGFLPEAFPRETKQTQPNTYIYIYIYTQSNNITKQQQLSLRATPNTRVIDGKTITTHKDTYDYSTVKRIPEKTIFAHTHTHI